jgi:hemolysin-activating ACP:hemolysin acyltransferase
MATTTPTTTTKAPAGNGAAATAAPLGQNPDSLRQLGALKFSSTLGQVVSVLMRSVQHRHSFLADLEWLVLPALASNQVAVLDAPNNANIMSGPAAAILFARVSPEVDKRLSTSPAFRVRLKPEEWTSGNIPWLVEAVGEQHAVSTLIKILLDQRFKATGLKTYSRGPDGKPIVGHMRASDAPPAAAAGAA